MALSRRAGAAALSMTRSAVLPRFHQAFIPFAAEHQVLGLVLLELERGRRPA